MSQLPGMNPWWKIWTKPRETIRAIVTHDKKHRFLLLSAFYGFLYLLNLAPLYMVGKLIKGKASYYEVRVAVSWSNVPNFFNIIVILFSLSMFGGKLYDPNMMGSLSVMGMNVAFLFTFFQLLFGIWAFVLLLHALGEVQGFSAWMALLNLVLMSILVGIVLIGGMWILGAIFHSS